MSIVRIGLAETKNFSDGWDAIFEQGQGAETGRRLRLLWERKRRKAKGRRSEGTSSQMNTDEH